MDEEQRRRRAIELLQQGRRPGEVLRELGRSREWLAKWRRRFAEAVATGLREVSRAHRTHPASTPAPIVRAVLRARDRLARRRGRQRFAGSGADAVAWELELAGVQPPPARRMEFCPLLHGQHTLPSWPVVCSPVPGWTSSVPPVHREVGQFSGAARG